MRSRAFPDIGADDLFLDRPFGRDEIEIGGAEPLLVHSPRRAHNLVNVLHRAERGQSELAGPQSSGDARPRTTGTAGDLVRTGLTGRGALSDASFVRHWLSAGASGPGS